VLTLATLDQLQAVTKDLTELDVVRVEAGQAVAVSVDAMPDEALAGVVREIALQPGDYRGDVVYAVTVDLTDAADLPLYWGMTALVEIQVH
jgi:multidrug resistance efflux pump